MTEILLKTVLYKFHISVFDLYVVISKSDESSLAGYVACDFVYASWMIIYMWSLYKHYKGGNGYWITNLVPFRSAKYHYPRGYLYFAERNGITIYRVEDMVCTQCRL